MTDAEFCHSIGVKYEQPAAPEPVLCDQAEARMWAVIAGEQVDSTVREWNRANREHKGRRRTAGVARRAARWLWFWRAVAILEAAALAGVAVQLVGWVRG